MVYRVFISSTLDEQTETYTRTLKQALWQLKEFPIAPMTMEDLVLTDDEPQDLLRQTLDESNVFIGIYGSTFGEYKHLNIADLIEYEYAYATERDIPTLIFLSANQPTTDERLQKFIQSIKLRQIVYTFETLDDLKAQMIVAITNYRQNARKRPPILPPLSELAPPQEQTQDQDFEGNVRRAYDLVEDDFENMMSRVLALHEARTNLIPSASNGDHEMAVNPIFGEPNKNIQFQSDIFMIMPFREAYDSIYKNVIVPTVNDMNLTIKRGDEFNTVSGQIISEVWAAINACRLVIVETTEENANVYYELGIAHTLGKPAILITQGKKVEDFPFDIRHLRFIVYDNTTEGGEKLEADLKQSIIWIINDLEDGIT
jgi:hypothetical protein